MPIVASASIIDGIYYDINSTDKTLTVTYGPYTGNLVIPSEVDLGEIYTVTAIAESAFGGCSGLTSVTIPNTVTTIGNNAFDGCSGLTSIVIPSSVTSIGDRVFVNCSGLNSVTLPNTITVIGNQFFSGCTSLASITIPISVTSIGNEAFYNCSSLTSITIPSSVTSIGFYAFFQCANLNSIDIQGNIPIIEEHTFDGCTSLTSITIPSSVKSINNDAFSGCTSLTNIEIPNGVSSILTHAFYGCTSLKSVSIPISVKSINQEVFWGCSNLKQVKIEDLGAWCKIQFGAYPFPYNHQLYLNNEEITNLVIPENITSVENYTFFGCSGLKTVSIHNNVNSIGIDAFGGCSNLISIVIPNSVSTIGNSAFYKCNSLGSIVIGNEVTSIGYEAFANCSAVKDVYSLAELVPKALENSFSNSNVESATLHVPSASIEAYKSIEPWSGFKEVVAIGESTPEYPKFIYEIGNESGWMTPHALCKIDDRNAYRGYYYLDGEFKFKPQEDLNDWNGDWEYDGEAIGATGKITPNGHANCPSVEPGFYQILVDLDEMTYIVSRIETIGICGSFTGWSADVDMTYDVKNNVWLADRVVFDQDDNDFKFRANHAWDLNWGGADDNLVFYGTELHLAAGSYDFALSLSYEGNNKVSIIPSSQKCATPTIIYENGKVRFACETLGVSFKYKIEIEDATENEGDEVSLTGIYKVTVYATKAGCKDSDVATKEINISGTGSGDLNGDGVINAADVVILVNSIMGE